MSDDWRTPIEPESRFPRPALSSLEPYPLTCLGLALLTDLAYWRTSNLMWANFSAWLLLAGIVLIGVALAVGLVDLLARSLLRRSSHAWLHWFCYLGVFALAFFDNLAHAGDGWTAIVPDGLLLTAATVILAVASLWIGATVRPFRHPGVPAHV